MKTRLRPPFTDGPLRAVLLLFVLLAAIPLGAALAQESARPQSPPDAELGLDQFAERCANCHGPTGGGDGELTANLPNPPAAFSAPEYRQSVIPAMLFEVITDGRVDRGMPPFGPSSNNAIDEESRWNLVAAIYSLSTPAAAIEQGQTIYNETCLACHGAEGKGDGPDAAALETPPSDLTNLDYWFSRSNETVFADVESGIIAAHDYTLSDEEQGAVVDFARTFSYAYIDPAELFAPIESATVTGQVINGTTGEPYPEAVAELRAFTPSFQQTLNLTTTVEADGTYRFSLTNVERDWVFLTSVIYNDLSFSSNAGQIRRAQPELTLPVTVYEHTTDPASVNIEQIHVVLGFQEDFLEVSELYVFSNNESAVFVGASGIPSEGTVEIQLPDNAQNPSFERSFGSLQRTVPADEMIRTESGWADTLPLRPGRGVLSLIARYEIPFSEGMRFTHGLAHNTNNVSVIMPDVGVTLSEEGWDAQGPQEMPGGGSFLSYSRANLAAGGTVELVLNGRPKLVADAATGNPRIARDTNTELAVGAGIFLVAVAIAAFIFRNWQTSPQGQSDPESEVRLLIEEIVYLDDAYERGEIGEEEYQQERNQLKAELKAIWGQ
ncbi:MAG: c-type cytochrome [Anaerolineae bacterium]